MKRILIILLGTALCFGTIGCDLRSKSNIIEEISPSVLLFVDRNESGNWIQTTIIPPARKENKQLLTEEATLMKEARNEFSKSFYREMKTGQLRILMISKALAESGILPMLNTLVLDPEISNRLFIAVVEGDYIRYLNSQLAKKQELPLEVYLQKMFIHYEKQGGLTITNLHQFMESYFSPYADPVLPLFKATEDVLTYQGTALFQGSRMLAHVDELDDILFQFLMEKSAFRKIFPLPQLQLSLGGLASTSQITVLPERTLHIRLALRGRIEEYHGSRNLTASEEAEALQREIELYLEDKLTSVIGELQWRGIDPLRVGERTLTLLKRLYSDKEWREVWKEMSIKTEVDLQLESLGLQQTVTQQ